MEAGRKRGPSPTLPAPDPSPTLSPRPSTACPGSKPTVEVHSSLCPVAWPLRSASRACGLQTLERANQWDIHQAEPFRRLGTCPVQVTSGLLFVSSGPPLLCPLRLHCPGPPSKTAQVPRASCAYSATITIITSPPPPPTADVQGAPTVHPGQCSNRLTYISQLNPRKAPEGPSYCDPRCPGDLTGAQGHPAQQWCGRDADPAGGALGQASLRTHSSDSLYPAPRGRDLVHPRW